MIKPQAAPDHQAQRQETQITFDPYDFEDMCKIMDEYGSSDCPFSGMNKNGEDVWISVFYDRITVKIHQRNGWVRINTHWRDGTREEIFDGRWRSREKSR